MHTTREKMIETERGDRVNDRVFTREAMQMSNEQKLFCRQNITATSMFLFESARTH